MRSLGANLGVAICGLVTSILVAIANVAVSNITGFNLFGFSMWFIIPAGAVCIGAAAASGYYFSSLYFHKKPTWFLVFQMVIIAGLTQFLIYYLEYATLVLDDGRKASDLVDFAAYLDISLTKAHYRIGRAAHDTGEVGEFGYTLAMIQFVGFLLGGAGVSVMLWTKDTCGRCSSYLRPLAQKTKEFSGTDSCLGYYDQLFLHDVDSPEFASMIQVEPVSGDNSGSIIVTTDLLGCPTCGDQLIHEKVEVANGDKLKNIRELERKVAIPEGVDLVPVFRG